MNEFHHSAEADHDTVRFRAMTEADIPAICEIEQESFTTPWTEGAFHNELTNNQFAKYTVLEFDGEVAGYGGMWLIMEEAHVTNIAIRQKYRGQKLGERLLTEMQQTASLFGVQRMTLEVRPSNEIARRLYEKKRLSVGRCAPRLLHGQPGRRDHHVGGLAEDQPEGLGLAQFAGKLISV